MIKFFTFLILICSIKLGHCQGSSKRTPIPIIEVPDSVSYRLACFLAGKSELKNEDDSSYLTMSIKNLSNVKDMKFKYGVFSFKHNSPHSSRQLFIYLSNGLYIFKSKEFEEIISEYLLLIKTSKIDIPTKTKYLKLISNFINDEYFTNKE